MTRLLLSIPDEMKIWLERYSHSANQPIAKIIRKAISTFIAENKTFEKDEIIKSTAGLWKEKNIDGLEYSNNIRDEWDSA